MTDALQPQFAEVLTLIKTAQQKVIATANQELIKLYWSIGEYISDAASQHFVTASQPANGGRKPSSN